MFRTLSRKVNTMKKNKYFTTIPVPSVAVADVIEKAEEQGFKYIDSLFAFEQKAKVLSIQNGGNQSTRFYYVIIGSSEWDKKELPSFTLGQNQIPCLKAAYH